MRETIFQRHTVADLICNMINSKGNTLEKRGFPMGRYTKKSILEDLINMIDDVLEIGFENYPATENVDACAKYIAERNAGPSTKLPKSYANDLAEIVEMFWLLVQPDVELDATPENKQRYLDELNNVVKVLKSRV